MKTKNIWLVALYTTITLGAYSIYWFAVQRAALRQTSKKPVKIPSWLWLLVPIATSVILFLPIVLVIILLGLAFDINSYQLSVTMYVVLSSMILIPVLITLWWLTYFGKAIAEETNGRMPRALTVALFIFIGAYVILFHQYYINQIATNKEEKLDAQNYPTVGFLFLAALLIVLSAVSYISAFAELPASVHELEQSITEAKDEFKGTDFTTNPYQSEQERILENRTQFN